MNKLSDVYFNMQCRFFPLLEEEIGEITEELQEFLRIIELVKTAREKSGKNENFNKRKPIVLKLAL